MRQEGLPRRVRLGGGAAFQEVFEQGRRFVGAHLVLRYLPATPDDPDPAHVPWRAAFVAGRKLGSAPDRNRTRRRVREAFRRLETRDGIPPGRYVFVARATARRAAFSVLQAEIRRLLDQAALTVGDRFQGRGERQVS